MSLHPLNLQGLLPRQNLSTPQASRRFTPSYPLSNPPWVWANMTRLHSVTRGRKGQGRGPRLLFSSSRMTGCWLDTRLADGISKGFQEPSGVGTIITNHASNKARRVTSWQKRSKTNSIMFLRDSILKKKIITRLTNWGFLQPTTLPSACLARNRANNILQLLALSKYAQCSPPCLQKNPNKHTNKNRSER